MTNNRTTDPSFFVVAIDGGAASGKTSTSRLLSKKRHFLHVDTGSHYRAVTRACMDAGVPPVEGEKLQAFLDGLSLGTVIVDCESLLGINGEAPYGTKVLRSEEVNHQVSPYSALPQVRHSVKAYQRSQVALAREAGFEGIIMDGRDIGTVILPHADLKVFLIADEATRQRRRSLEGSRDTIAARDKTDSTRSVAPLKPAADALVLDNSGLSLPEVAAKIEILLQGIQ